MLSTKEVLKPVFFKPASDELKEIEFITVDGGHDEGPSHCEVQYWWTVYHLKAQTVATMITTRNSGASYKNRVELQNGCLALGHANLFVPSALNGSCLTDNGKVNETNLKENLSSAINVYIRPPKSTCSVVLKVKLIRMKTSWSVFLKGSKAAKQELQKNNLRCT